MNPIRVDVQRQREKLINEPRPGNEVSLEVPRESLQRVFPGTHLRRNAPCYDLKIVSLVIWLPTGRVQHDRIVLCPT